MTGRPLRHALLDAIGVEHGFGVRDAATRNDILRPVQVHGTEVATVDEQGTVVPEQADAIVGRRSRQCVGVVTADCVPILIGSERGAVAAVHAGWRGLAAGVIERGVAALAAHVPVSAMVAVIGPHIGACCYEVDAPVIDALTARFGAEATGDALRRTRPGHALLELARLTEVDLVRAGISSTQCGMTQGCTSCDADRFHSYRRDGARAGRLVHFIAPA
jgi:YfiH family protein